jgi:L-alanine-DL-glutamate epimerase-like enolase superfamily enzyme
VNQRKEKNNDFEVVLYHVELPMNSTFGHLAAQRNKSDSLVVKIRFNNHIGIGECAPRNYVNQETSQDVIQHFQRLDLNKLKKILTCFDSEEILSHLSQVGFSKTFGIFGSNNLICLLELAVFDLLGHMLQKSGYRMLKPAHLIDSNKILKISQVLDQNLPVEDFLETRRPFHFIKIKGHLDLTKDIEIVKTIRKYVNYDIPIMIDANMGWNLDSAIKHINRLHDIGVNFVEEPLMQRSWSDLKILKQKTQLPLMLDESICNIDDLQVAITEKCCDLINIRIAKCGGIFNSLNLIRKARDNGLKFQIGVQVAECGPLINASQILAFNNSDAITIESGQSDLFFNEMIIYPKPIIDRKFNVIYRSENFGLGFTNITNIINKFKVVSD